MSKDGCTFYNINGEQPDVSTCATVQPFNRVKTMTARFGPISGTRATEDSSFSVRREEYAGSTGLGPLRGYRFAVRTESI